MIEIDIERCMKTITGLVEPLVNGETPVAGLVSDVLTHHRVRPIKQGPKNDIHSKFVRLLGHIPVNPSRSENAYFLKASYVYPDNAATQTEARQAVANADAKTATDFLRRLIETARQERDRSVGYLAPKSQIALAIQRNGDHLFTLMGPRGSGKTFFLNYLFTHNAEYLDQQEVIWVRVNLISDRGYDGDIVGWTHAQIAKILLRYYDTESAYRRPGSISFGFCEMIDTWIETEAKESLRHVLRTAFQTMRDVFVNRGSDQDISTNNMNTMIAAQLYLIAREIGLSFIVVYDGFDRLDHDQRNTPRFKTISEALLPLVLGNARFGAAFLVVTRSETFAWLACHPNWAHHDNRTWRIGAPAVTDVVLKRLDALSNWSGAYPDIPMDQIREGVGSTATKFRAYLDSVETVHALTEVDETLRGNCRAKIQMVELIFAQHLQDNRGQGYKIVELLVKAGYNYPPLFYRYFVDGEELRADIVEGLSYDNRFLPILTRPCLPTTWQGEISGDYYGGIASILHSVRVLQTLFVARDVVPNEWLSIDDVVGMMESWFGYNPTVTRALIYEHESFEVIRVRRDRDTFDDNDNDNIRLTDKGQILIAKMIVDPAYLNLCAMRTLAPDNWHDTIRPFEANELSGDEQDHGASVRRWSATKMRNTTVLSALILAINAAQRHQFEQAPKQKFGQQRRLLESGQLIYMFDHFDKAMRDLPKAIAAIGIGAHLNEDELRASFRQMETRWIEALGGGGVRRPV